MSANLTQPSSSESLTIIDNRTGNHFHVPITDGQYINSSDFKDAKQFSSTSQTIPQSPINTLQLRLYDPAFMNTAVVRSGISFVDGDNGILLYRGYPIEELVEKSNFLDVCHLLIWGSLPTKKASKHWHSQVMKHTIIHTKLADLMHTFHYDAHPMGMFISTMAAMSTFHPEANPSLSGDSQLLCRSPELRNKQLKRIIGKVTTIAANAYRHRIGRDFNQPLTFTDSMYQGGNGDQDFMSKGSIPMEWSYAANFLHMLDHLPGQAVPSTLSTALIAHPTLVRALDQLFIIHAEHEMNCSTTAMRLIGSSMVDPYCAITGAAAALYGPSHGGACEAVIHMLEDITKMQGESLEERIATFLDGVKDKKFKLMGFGHRVYKSRDPRCLLVKGILERVFALCGGDNDLFSCATLLEEMALKDGYFVERKLFANVDFYTGLIYRAMGFPTDFFPLLFAVPRTAGWLAHWNEMVSCTAASDGSSTSPKPIRIWRPRQIYCGNALRPFPVESNDVSDNNSTTNDSDLSYMSSGSGQSSMYKRYSLAKNHYLEFA